MPTKETVEARRRQVWEMILRGISESVTAKTLGVHRNTVVNDVRMMRVQHRSQVSDADVQEEVGDITAKFDYIFQTAMAEFSTARRPGTRGMLLEKALSALQSKAKFLVEVGTLPKAAQEITGKLLVDGMDISKMSLEALKSLRNRMAQNLNTMGLLPKNRLPADDN